MKTILFILTIFALAILYSQSTKEATKYKDFYISVLHKEYTATENHLIDTLDTLPNDSLVNRLHELNSLLNEQ